MRVETEYRRYVDTYTKVRTKAQYTCGCIVIGVTCRSVYSGYDEFDINCDKHENEISLHEEHIETLTSIYENEKRQINKKISDISSHKNCVPLPRYLFSAYETEKTTNPTKRKRRKSL